MKMKYKVYQIPVSETPPYYAFMGREELKDLRLPYPPPRDAYQLVYEGTTDNFSPEQLFEELNVRHPADYKARSLSVSDVVVYDLGRNGELALFCDSFGFRAIHFTDDATEEIKAEFFPKADKSYILLGTDTQRMRIDPIALLGHLRICRTEDGRAAKLDAAQVYVALECLYRESDKYRLNGKQKTLREWQASGLGDFDSYAGIGDEVDEELYMHFLNILPPASMTYGYLQVDEPICHMVDPEDGRCKPVFLTFGRKNEKWRYLGHCFYRKTENRYEPKSFHSHYLELLG